MEDLFRELLAPLSPTSPNPSLPLPTPSPAQNAETKTTCGAAPQIDIGAGVVVSGSEMSMGVEIGSGMGIGMDVGMDMADIGLGIDVNPESGEQWTTSELDVQKILESLSEGYEAYRQQQVLDLDSIELGWNAFGPSEGLGVSAF